MNPSCNDQYQNRTDHRRNYYRPELCLDDIKIKHQRHTGRDEEKSHVGDKELAYGGYGSRAYPSALQQKAEQQHPPDAPGYAETRDERKQFADTQTPEDNTKLFRHSGKLINKK